MNYTAAVFTPKGSLASMMLRRGAMPRWLYEAMLIVAGTALIAVCAHIAIPLWFTPVPITGQTFAVLLIGALYGSRRGVATMLAYLAEGAAGLPVFAPGQAGGAGVAHLFGPTGGYLLGFVVAAFIVGALAERGWDRSFGRSLIAMTIGTVAIFAVGLTWLSAFVGWGNVLATGLIPFIPGGIIKIILAASLLPVGWKILSAVR